MMFIHKPLSAFCLGICAFLAGTLPVLAAEALPGVVVAVSGAPKTLDPALATDAAGARLLQLTNPALLRLDERFQPVGLVAQRCVPDAAFVKVVCQIPAGRRFHDGTPLTAEELRGWFVFLKDTPRSPLAGSLAEVVAIHALPDNRLEFVLGKPNLGFLQTLVDIPLAPTPHNAKLGEPRAGLGWYKLGGASTESVVTLQPVGPQVPPLTFTALADPTTRLLKLKRGEVDVVLHDLPPELVTWAKQQGWSVVNVPSSSTSYLAINFGNEYLAQVDVRRALDMAIDRPAIRQYLLGGMASPAGSLLPPGGPATWEAPETKPNIGEANDMLDALALVGDAVSPRFNLTLLTSTDPLSQRVAQVLQEQVRRVGVQLDIKPLEWGAFYQALKSGRFDLALASWTGVLPPEFLTKVFASDQTPPKGMNRGRVRVAELDGALGRILAAGTVQEQTEAAVAAQKMQAEVLPYLMLYRRNHVMVTRPDVQGCSLPLDGGYAGLLACRK